MLCSQIMQSVNEINTFKVYDFKVNNTEKMQSYNIPQYNPNYINTIWHQDNQLLNLQAVPLPISEVQQCFLCCEKLPNLDAYEVHLKKEHEEAAIKKREAMKNDHKKNEKNRRARERMVIKRMNPEYRARENERKRLKRQDPVYRKYEQERNTLLHRRKRLDPVYREKERKRNTEQRRIKRMDAEYRAKEQARNTLQKRKKREDPMYRFIEQMNEKERRRKKKLKLENKTEDVREEIINNQPVKVEVYDPPYFGIENPENTFTEDEFQNWAVIADQLQEHIKFRLKNR